MAAPTYARKPPVSKRSTQPASRTGEPPGYRPGSGRPQAPGKMGGSGGNDSRSRVGRVPPKGPKTMPMPKGPAKLGKMPGKGKASFDGPARPLPPVLRPPSR